MQTKRFFPGSSDYPTSTDLPAFDGDTLVQRRVDAHWVAYVDGKPCARVSLWHRKVPGLPGERLGIVGHYAATDPVSGSAILRRACEELAAAGCTLAVGPMDGDTWHSYRFVTERGEAPPFFLEPWQPTAWLEHWREADFGTLAEYHSTVSGDLTEAVDDPRQRQAQSRVEAAGISLRVLEPAFWDDELRRIYSVAAASFRSNFLYTPLASEAFLALYAPLKTCVQPRLVLIAEDANTGTVGFALGLPNLFDTTGKTFIVKTVAVLPEVAGIGLGRVLVDRLHLAGRTLGYRRAIHALMHDDNVSRHLSARFGSEPLRRYALLARHLP